MSKRSDIRRTRRRRVIRRAAALAKELYTEEKAQAEFLVDIINKAIDIPGLGENAERKILLAVAELLIDLVVVED